MLATETALAPALPSLAPVGATAVGAAVAAGSADKPPRPEEKQDRMQFNPSNKPIPPLSKVRLVRAFPDTPDWQTEVGRLFRVGYYNRTDGLDCIWLVNDGGVYEQTTDHETLLRCFDIELVSDETDLFGDKRPEIGVLN